MPSSFRMHLRALYDQSFSTELGERLRLTPEQESFLKKTEDLVKVKSWTSLQVSEDTLKHCYVTEDSGYKYEIGFNVGASHGAYFLTITDQFRRSKKLDLRISRIACNLYDELSLKSKEA